LYGCGIAAEVIRKNYKNYNAKGKNNSGGKISRHHNDLLRVGYSKINRKGFGRSQFALLTLGL
jgi:hypothetical protein